MSGRETIRGKHGAGALLSLGWSRIFETRLKKEKKKPPGKKESKIDIMAA